MLLTVAAVLAEGREIEGVDVVAPQAAPAVEELGEVDLFAQEGGAELIVYEIVPSDIKTIHARCAMNV